MDTEEVSIRIVGAAGRITLTRPQARNALTFEICQAISAALDVWALEKGVSLVVIDGAGDDAFCAGGDIRDIYAAGCAGDFDHGRRFWREEYRMVHRLAYFPKPVVSLCHGYTLGGGVGLGCHASHRVVCETSRLSLPEVSIGLVADVGSTALLAAAPGQVGVYLGLTAARIGPGDAIFAGLADSYVPHSRWSGLTARLEANDLSAIAEMAEPNPDAPLAAAQPWIDRCFTSAAPEPLLACLGEVPGEMPARAAAAVARNAPLAMAATAEIVARLRTSRDGVAEALALEYRFAHRVIAHGDLLEGIRAALIDRDGQPNWGDGAVDAMLAPLGHHEWTPPASDTAVS